MDPRVLILDDATASVDANTEARIKLALREVMQRPHHADHRPPAVHHLAGRRTWWCSTAAASSPSGEHASLLEQSPVYQEIYRHGLVERTFVQLDPDGAPIEKEDVA